MFEIEKHLLFMLLSSKIMISQQFADNEVEEEFNAMRILRLFSCFLLKILIILGNKICKMNYCSCVDTKNDNKTKPKMSV
jgi:hypothetical protein